MKLEKVLKSGLLAILAISLVLLPACDTDDDDDDRGSGGLQPPIMQVVSCEYRDNLDSTADNFISRCRKASIRREFPGEYYGTTLRAISQDNSANGRKAYKLLNDNRFKK